MKSQIYFPILRAKAGEFSALAGLSEPTKALVCPIVDLPKFPEMEKFEQKNADVVRSLVKTWGTANALFLDLSRYEPDDKTPQGEPLVKRLLESARQYGLKAAPVVGTVQDRYGTNGDYFRHVARAMSLDKRGVAIRLPHDDLLEPQRLNSVVDEVQRLLDAGDGDCTVIMDVGPIEKLPASKSKVVDFLEEMIQPAIRCLGNRRFRAVVFSGSSIPASLGRSADGELVKIPNAEFLLWSRLVRSDSGRLVRFGDHAARYAHQTDKGSKASPPARINLATTQSHVICVGDHSSYRELARRIVGTPEFKGQKGSWGKYAVRDAAIGGGGVGVAADWVARDTHMHIETMASAVRQRLVEEGEEFGAVAGNAFIYDQADLGF